MKFQQNLLYVATATTLLGIVSAAPANAFTFGNSGIQFDTDTTVNFEFLQSHGWWYGDFGVVETLSLNETFLISETRHVNPGSGWEDDNKGTAGLGLAVENPFSSFTFKSGIEYSFFLRSYDVRDPSQTYTQYSNTLMNPQWYQNGTGGGAMGDGTFMISGNSYDSSLDGQILDGRQRALFQGDVFGSGTTIFFEDNTSWGNNDFDDFIVSARVVESESVPEPATLMGLVVIVGSATLLRRRKQGQVS